METFLARGSFGDVFLLEENGQKCVIKYVNEDVAQNYLKERDVLEMLTHSNIVAYIGTRKQNGQFGIMLEYCERGSLKTVIDNCSIVYSIRTVVVWGREMFEALEFLEENHIVHRDLKPDNVLITDAYRAKLGDFGSCKMFEGTCEERSIVGTARYTSPPKIDWEENDVKSSYITISHKNDVYSLGLILWELIERRRVLSQYEIHTSISSSFNQIQFHADVLLKKIVQLEPPNCEDKLKEFVMNCVNFNYDNRFDISESLKQIKDLIKTDSSLSSFDFLPEIQQEHKIPIRPIGFDGTKNKIPIQTIKDLSFSIPDGESFSSKISSDFSNQKTEPDLEIEKYFPKLRASNENRERFFHKFISSTKEERDEFINKVSNYIEFHFQTFNSYYYYGIDEMKDNLDMEILFCACLMIDYISQLQCYFDTFELISDYGNTYFGGWLLYRELVNMREALSNFKKLCYSRRIYFKCYFSTYTREEWLLLKYVEGRECQFVRKDLKSVKTFLDKTIETEPLWKALSKVFSGREVPKELYLQKVEKGRKVDEENVRALEEYEEMHYVRDEPIDIYMLIGSLDEKIEKIRTSLEIKCDNFILPIPKIDETMKPMIESLKLKSSPLPGYIFQLKNPPRSKCECITLCHLVCGVPYPEEIPYQMKIPYFDCQSMEMRAYLEFYANFRIGMDIALRKEKNIGISEYDPNENIEEEFSGINYFLFSLLNLKINGEKKELLMLDAPSNCGEFERIPCIDLQFTLFSIEASTIVKENLIPKISIVPIFYDREFKFTMRKQKIKISHVADGFGLD